MGVTFSDTVIPTSFIEGALSVRLSFDFENKERRMTPNEFWDFCAQNPRLRAELTKEGDVVIMAPTGFGSSEANSEIVYQLKAWAKDDRTGTVTESNGAYVLANGAAYAPDAAWTRNERLKGFSREERQKFLHLSPDFVIELVSPSDSLNELCSKMVEWIENGVRLAWLIDPERKRVHIYRPNREPEISENASTISGEDVLPGFDLDLTEIW